MPAGPMDQEQKGNQKMKLLAVIFDLDGVIVSTDDCHYEAWKRLADDEGIYFDRDINKRLRGVSRMESLAIILERSDKVYSAAERERLAEIKNDYYRKLIADLTPARILPGVTTFLSDLRKAGLKLAVGSSSKNTPLILDRIGMAHFFDAVADGNEITKSKPDPEVFLLAARKLGVPPENCAVVEDAEAGIEAALAGGMLVLGVGAAAGSRKATFGARDLSTITAADFQDRCNRI